MKRTRTTRAAFALGVALAMGFGAREALAAPSAGEGPGACNPQLCDRVCKAIGAFGGTCVNGGCSCYITAP
ncbi:MAG TPA: hypothetical protein VFQ39_07795 [Longimicrobium sp.]|nr:hypothetical protein [Longimicrobium sp.]